MGAGVHNRNICNKTHHLKVFLRPPLLIRGKLSPVFVDLMFIPVPGNVGGGSTTKPAGERSGLYMNTHLVALQGSDLIETFATLITGIFLITILSVHCLHVSRHVLDHFSTQSAGILLSVVSPDMLLVPDGVVEHLGAEIANEGLIGMIVTPVVVESLFALRSVATIVTNEGVFSVRLGVTVLYQITFGPEGFKAFLAVISAPVLPVDVEFDAQLRVGLVNVQLAAAAVPSQELLPLVIKDVSPESEGEHNSSEHDTHQNIRSDHHHTLPAASTPRNISEIEDLVEPLMVIRSI